MSITTLETISAFLIVIIIGGLFLLLVMSYKKNEDLEKAKQNLKEDNSKLSNKLREKGIEVDRLGKKNKRLEKE